MKIFMQPVGTTRVISFTPPPPLTKLKRVFQIFFGISFLFIPQFSVFSQTATAPAAGAGTAGNPWQIATLNNLYWIYASTARWDDHYIQTADINASATSTWNSNTGWMPIGNATTKFTGSYNGNGFSISGLTINRGTGTTGDYSGLFGYAQNASFLSIRMVSVSIIGYTWVGGIVGRMDDCSIDSCFTSGSISVPSASGRIDVGGWAGHVTSTSLMTISQGANQASVSGYSRTGGLFGYVNAPINFDSCTNSGAITASGHSTVSDYAGGIFGYNLYQGLHQSIVKNCSNSGAIQGADYVGGLFGHILGAADIRTCSNSGNISASAGEVGGFVGECLNLYINQCTNTAASITTGVSSTNTYIGGWVGKHGYNDTIFIKNVTTAVDISGYSEVGGFFGQTNAPISFQNCHNSGDITASNHSTGSVYSGGFIGINTYSSSLRPTYLDCSNSGPIKGARYVGGLAGRLYIADIRNCSNSGNITATYGFVGGFVGQGDNLYINYCSNSANSISSSNSSSGSTYVGGWVGYHTYSDTIYIKNITTTIDVSGYSEVGGFFGRTDAPISFQNCHNSGDITASNHSTGSVYSGGFIGINTYSSSLRPTYLDCSNSGPIKGARYVGGLAGRLYIADIRNCSNSGNITATYGFVGGFVGQGDNLYINYCSNSAVSISSSNSSSGSTYVGGWVGYHTYSDTIFIKNVTTSSDVSGYSEVGGFFGWTNAPISFENCHNSGDITASGSPTGSTYSGGFIGLSTYNSTLRPTYRNCSNSGLIQGARYIGGFAGRMYKGDIRSCSNSANITATYGFVGGFVGQGDNLYINYCSNSAVSISSSNSTAASTYIGGWVGYHTYSDTIFIKNITTTTDISGYSEVGGFFGWTNAPISFENCHNSGDITASGSLTSANYSGGFIGHSTYNSTLRPTYRNCSNSGLIQGAKYIGGFAGRMYKGDIRSCSNSANITGTYGYVGGFVGQGDNLYINYCTNTAISISGGTDATDVRVGGWVGYHTYSDTIYIQNLTNSTDVTGHEDVGGFFGESNASISFFNCHNSGDISASGSASTSNYAGGLIGNFTPTSPIPTIVNCSNSGTIQGAKFVGGLFGQISNGSLSYCSNTGPVAGSYGSLGGIFGSSSGTATLYRCHNTATVTSVGNSNSLSDIGGLIGKITGGVVEECYAIANVNGYSRIGGLIGSISNATVRNSYAHGTVAASSSASGGLVGAFSAGNLINSYSVGAVASTGVTYGGLVGTFGGTTTRSYWDTQTSGQAASATGNGRTTAQMQLQSTFVDWNFLTIWHLDSCNQNNYPILRWQNINFDNTNIPAGEGTVSAPYQINTLRELYWLMVDRKRWNLHYEQTASIDADTIPIVCGHGATPIGDAETPFSGSYNGQYFQITNLDIQVPSAPYDYIGLFGNSTGTLSNIILANVSTKGRDFVGTLVGRQSGGSITECGIQSGSAETHTANDYVGGLAGALESSALVHRCFSRATVASANGQNSGGFVGFMTGSADVYDSYAAGSVTYSGSAGSYGPGAFAGRVQNSGTTVSRCYAIGSVPTGSGFIGSYSSASSSANFFDLQTTGQTTSAGNATACSTSVMKTMGNFSSASWDFICETVRGTNDYWGRNTTDNNEYPWLAWEGYTAECPLWTGAISEDWATAGNWSPAEVPVQGAEITFSATASNHAKLDQDRMIHSLNFNSSGKHCLLDLHDLTALSILGAGPTSYVRTDTTGMLRMPIENNQTLTLPTGRSSFNPLTLTNKSGALDTFSLYIADEVYDYGTFGQILTSTPRVTRTWHIGKENPNANSGIDFIFHWNPGEVSGTINNWALFHHGAGGWEEVVVGNLSQSESTLSFSGYTGSFSPFGIGDQNQPLPVDLLYLNAECENGQSTIQWATASEVNADFFELQRSADLKAWEPVSRVEAQGFSSHTHTYPPQNDDKVYFPTTYYRLRQVDFDGRQEFFGPIAANCNAPAMPTPIFPNPCSHELFVQFKSQHSTWVVADLTGRQLLKGTATNGLNALNLQNLPAGAYILNLGQEFIPFMKK